MQATATAIAAAAGPSWQCAHRRRTNRCPVCRPCPCGADGQSVAECVVCHAARDAFRSVSDTILKRAKRVGEYLDELLAIECYQAGDEHPVLEDERDPIEVATEWVDSRCDELETLLRMTDASFRAALFIGDVTPAQFSAIRRDIVFEYKALMKSKRQFVVRRANGENVDLGATLLEVAVRLTMSLIEQGARWNKVYAGNGGFSIDHIVGGADGEYRMALHNIENLRMLPNHENFGRNNQRLKIDAADE